LHELISTGLEKTGVGSELTKTGTELNPSYVEFIPKILSIALLVLVLKGTIYLPVSDNVASF